jgi:hypothetical protein
MLYDITLLYSLFVCTEHVVSHHHATFTCFGSGTAPAASGFIHHGDVTQHVNGTQVFNMLH